MNRILAFSGVSVTLASYKLGVVGYLAVLYVKAVQQTLTIEPVVERSVSALESTRSIPYYGPGEPGGEITLHLSSDWLRLFLSGLEQTGKVLCFGHDNKSAHNL